MATARPVWFCLTGGWVALALFCVLALGSCSRTTAPEDASLRITYSPTEEDIVIPLDAVVAFRVSLENAPGAVVQFCRGDSVLVTGMEYFYEGRRIGSDILCVIVSLPDATYRKEWRITVDGENAQRPPIVPDQAVVLGPSPGSIIVRWTQPPPASVPRPLSHYTVAITYDTTLTEITWEDAIVLEQVDHIPGPSIGYARTYDDDIYETIIPGEEIRVAVRAEDEAGLLSPIGDPMRIRISTAYSLQGYIRDDAGRPLHGIIVDYGCDTCRTATDVSGWFELGPFRDVDAFALTTLSRDVNTDPENIDAYYDVQTDTLEVDSPQPIEITLISRWGIDPNCGSQLYADDFLTYLMHITRTDQTISGRPNQNLLKWESYPLTVYVHAALNDAQTFAMDSLAVETLRMWNEKLGEDYFVQVDLPTAADIEIIFTNEGLGLNHGLAQIVNDGVIYRINQVIPQKMEVLIRTSLNNPRYAHEVLLHEIGHALCLGNHSSCDALVHLMCPSPAGIIDAHWPGSPINDDEARAVSAIRYLPQAMPMDRFISE